LSNWGRCEKAVASFNRALEIQPDYYQAWFNRGVDLAKLGNHQEAIASFDKVISFQPGDVVAWYNKACCYALQGNIDLAIENFQQAIKLNPQKYREIGKKDSKFENIRQDGRFQALIQ